MAGAFKPRLVQASVRLVAFSLLFVCLVNAVVAGPSPALAAACAGDEQILFFASAPRVGSSVVVAVFSQAPHEQAVLLGPSGPIPLQRDTIGESFVWQHLLALDRAGENLFVFGVSDGTMPLTPCANATILVGEASLAELLNPYASPDPQTDGFDDGGVYDEPLESTDDATEVTDAAPGPRVAAARPTRTPTPAPDNTNDNDDENDNRPTKTPTRTPTRTRETVAARQPTSTREPTATREPTSTRTPRPAATDTPAPTPTLEPPSISSVDPGSAVCGQSLTIRGQRFGSSQNAVDGEVRVDGRESEIDSWGMTQVRIKVPLTSRAGNDRQLEVRVAGNTVSRSVRVSC